MDPVTLAIASSRSGYVSVKAYGAVGDGESNDTVALQRAFEAARQQGGRVFIPAGVYMIDAPLLLYSGISCVGAGMDRTIIRAVPHTVFPAIKIHSGVADERDIRFMLAPESRGDNGVTEDIHIADLTIDWNACPASGRSTSPLWIDSARDVRIERVRVENALPSDAQPGALYRGHALYVTQSHNVVMDGVELGTAHYRSLGVSYGATEVTFKNGRVWGANPWRHLVEIHGGPGSKYESVGPLRLIDSHFRATGGGVEDYVCNHGAGPLIIRGCTFDAGENGIVSNLSQNLSAIVKHFDGATDLILEGNTFTFRGTPIAMPMVALDHGDRYRPITRAVVVGNTFNIQGTEDVRVPSSLYSPWDFSHGSAVLFGLAQEHRGVVFQGNSINMWGMHLPYYAMAIRSREAVFNSNVVRIGARSGSTPDGMVLLKDAKFVAITGNTCTGAYLRAAVIHSTEPGGTRRVII